MGTQPPELEDKDGEQNEAPQSWKKWPATGYKLRTHNCVGLDEIHLRVARELIKVLTHPPSLMYQQSCLTGDVLADWRFPNRTSINKKGRKEDPGNYRPVRCWGRSLSRSSWHPVFYQQLCGQQDQGRDCAPGHGTGEATA